MLVPSPPGRWSIICRSFKPCGVGKDGAIARSAGGGIAWFKSDAALTVLSHLPGWGLTRVLFGLPKPLRDAVYNLFARNRYRIFGKYESCFMPDAAMRGRVLE